MSPDSGIRRRILGAVGAEALGQVLNLGIRIMLVPLFLTSWGAQIYGEWVVLTALAAWFGLGDFGGQLYFVNRMTTAWSAGRREEFQTVLSTGMLMFISSSAAIFCCVAFALIWPGWLSWFGVKAVPPQLARMVLMFMALRFLLALPMGLLLAVFRSTGSQAVSVMYVNLMLIIQFAGSATALLCGAGMVTLASLEVLPFMAVSILICRDLKQRLPAEIKLFALGRADRSILREAVSPSLHFMGIQLAQILVIQGSVIALAKALGPVEVAIFATMRTVSNVISQFLAMLNHSAWPEFTRLHATGQTEKLIYLFKVILSVTLLGGLAYLVFLHNLGSLVYSWWLHQKLPYDPTTMFLMGCFVILTTMWVQGGSLLMATNQHEQYALLQLPVNAFALCLCYLGAMKFGLSGAVLGLVIGQSALMVGIVAVLMKKKGWGSKAAWLSAMSAGALAAFPMCLNLWSGLAVIAMSGGLMAHHFGWWPFSTHKPALQ